MITNDYTELINEAHQLARPIRSSEHCSAGSVASVIVSRSGRKYTGICLDFACSVGFCAEHAAISEMLKAHESEIAFVVAVNENGTVYPPCGRCREMMWQLNDGQRQRPRHSRSGSRRAATRTATVQVSIERRIIGHKNAQRTELGLPAGPRAARLAL